MIRNPAKRIHLEDVGGGQQKGKACLLRAGDARVDLLLPQVELLVVLHHVDADRLLDVALVERYPPVEELLHVDPVYVEQLRHYAGHVDVLQLEVRLAERLVEHLADDVGRQQVGWPCKEAAANKDALATSKQTKMRKTEALKTATKMNYRW